MHLSGDPVGFGCVQWSVPIGQPRRRPMAPLDWDEAERRGVPCLLADMPRRLDKLRMPPRMLIRALNWDDGVFTNTSLRT